MFDDFTSYNILKWIHIMSAFLLFGTGLGTAFYKWMSDRSGDIRVQAVTGKHVVMADWMFTTPTVFIQPITGFLLLYEMGISFFEPWVIISLLLFGFAGLCWLPVVWLQIEMVRLANEAVKQDTPLPENYHRMARIWFILGWPAFMATLVIVWLMITKPDITLPGL